MTEATITIEDIPVTTDGQAAKLVKFAGQLDESNVDEKAKTIYSLLEEVPQNLLLLFDFEGLEYMNSKSIGYLTDWYGKVSEGGGKITIAKAKSNILDILQVVGLTQLINCFPTVDEAKFSLLNAGEGEVPTPEAAEGQGPVETAPVAEEEVVVAPPPAEEEVVVAPPAEEAPAPEAPAAPAEAPAPEVTTEEAPAPTPEAPAPEAEAPPIEIDAPAEGEEPKEPQV
ncbi:STAS domain-containing protein [Pseudomonadota bacterium]